MALRIEKKKKKNGELVRRRSVAVSRVRCRCGGPGVAPVLSRLPAIVFLSFSFFFYYKVQIQMEARNREKRSDHSSQNREVRLWSAQVPIFFP